MRANAKAAAAPGDGAPGAEEPALIKMSSQHTKLSQARSEEPTPTKLNDQHNTHPMPVRAHNGHRAAPWPEHALRTAISLYSSSPDPILTLTLPQRVEAGSLRLRYPPPRRTSASPSPTLLDVLNLGHV